MTVKRSWRSPTSAQLVCGLDGHARLPGLPTKAWQRLLVGLSLLLVVTLLLAVQLSSGRAVNWPFSTAAPLVAMPTQVSTQPGADSLPPTPTSPQLVPTVVLNSSEGHAVGPAPAQCSQESPALTADGNPAMGLAIGTAPVLVGGFVGPYATLPVGSAASARLNFPGWTQPYSRYGWPALIDLILHRSVTGPVTLSGRDAQTGYPLWFGFVMPGVVGAPQQVTLTLPLDPAHTAIPAGGETSGEDFWYGYAFLPGAGCYTLTASWPGGSWQITVSAGALSAIG